MGCNEPARGQSAVGAAAKVSAGMRTAGVADKPLYGRLRMHGPWKAVASEDQGLRTNVRTVLEHLFKHQTQGGFRTF